MKILVLIVCTVTVTLYAASRMFEQRGEMALRDWSLSKMEEHDLSAIISKHANGKTYSIHLFGRNDQYIYSSLYRSYKDGSEDWWINQVGDQAIICKDADDPVNAFHPPTVAQILGRSRLTATKDRSLLNDLYADIIETVDGFTEIPGSQDFSQITYLGMIDALPEDAFQTGGCYRSQSRRPSIPPSPLPSGIYGSVSFMRRGD